MIAAVSWLEGKFPLTPNMLAVAHCVPPLWDSRDVQRRYTAVGLDTPDTSRELLTDVTPSREEDGNDLTSSPLLGEDIAVGLTDGGLRWFPKRPSRIRFHVYSPVSFVSMSCGSLTSSASEPVSPWLASSSRNLLQVLLMIFLAATDQPEAAWNLSRTSLSPIKRFSVTFSRLSFAFAIAAHR